MNKENIPVITDREKLYDKCENMEQLFDKYYLPLLDKHYSKTYELQQENEKLKADYGTKVQVERDLLKEENKILKENAENNDKVVDKVNWENQLLKKENKQLKDLIDTILNFSFFKEECPLNFGFENNTNEDKSQSIFYEDEWCENNCNDNYKDCWLKYFKKLQELEGSDE